MNRRIEELTKLTLSGKMYVEPIKTEFVDNDTNLSLEKREAKNLCEFILNQKPMITPYSKMTGFFNCDDSIVGDAFRRAGHKSFNELKNRSYLKPINNLSTFEWQHATADYRMVLNKGLSGIIDDITNSITTKANKDEINFLSAIKEVALTLIAWAEKCSLIALDLSNNVQNSEYKENLVALSKALKNVPKNRPTSFYEAVLAIYVCFSADPDSIGTLDRYLFEFYENDLKNHRLTREEAKEYLQELFLMLQAATKATSPWFTRGGESHFCVGGYLPDGSDGFSELSSLILESLLELPTWIPQVTFRWTSKTKKEDFRHLLDLERKDPHKRIAFQNDDKRIKCYTEICGFPFEKAVEYTTTGCNEPAFLGAVTGATSAVNFARSIETLFHKKSEKLINIDTFDKFYNVFLEELFSDIELAHKYDDEYNLEKAKDINYLSSIFFQGCIEKGISLTNGAADIIIASPMYIGIVNVIDSLIVVKQFVYDEKIITMNELISALKSNWQGYEDIHALILNKGDFFGNDTTRSNFVARKLYQSLFEFLKDKKNVFGCHWLIGDLTGYNDHPRKFGINMSATPDGRYSGDSLKFGLGQSEGKDRNGLSALLNSVATVDPNAIGCGSTVTNIMIDESLVKNEANFDKTVDLLETYFKNGGVHFQLNYISKSDLLSAKIKPKEYKNLRVRVSGFSDYFVKLSDGMQTEIIERTSHK